MRLRLALAAAAFVLAGCGSGAEGQPGAPSPQAAGDVRALAEHMRSAHADLFHNLSRSEFSAARDRLVQRAPELEADELLVELMRFAALAGERDGHTGIFPLDPGHRQQLHLFPLRLYDFPEGIYVVAQVGLRRDLVGKRLVAVEGVPVAQALARVRPLVPRDNEHSLRARAVQWLVTAEVLHGLGLTDERLSARFSFADGSEAELAAVPAARYGAAFPDSFHPMVPQGLPPRPSPPFLRNRNRSTWTQVLGNGRAVYLAYNLTTVYMGDVAARVRRLAARPRVDRVIVDLRHNPGGNNYTYAPLLETLRELPRRVRLLVLVGRTTFSAAQNLTADLERLARRPRFVGEPTGGSPNLYGDPSTRQLPASGWNTHVATIYWQKSRPGDRRLTLEPDVPARYTAADFFAGRDPVLRRALR
ncbi:MAG TPA: hypothetical protein VNP93_13890 [Gaiellaceae bacterium]|nr:hypothetical protein [Gaiellaceae bacterium]